jgi:Fe-S-cluster containining protein
MTQATNIFYLIIIAFLFYLNFGWHIRVLLLSNRQFGCLRCGHCCRLVVRLSDKDIERLEKAGKKDFIKLKGKTKTLRQENGYCPFLSINSGKARCTVYEHRPDICMTFPAQKIMGIRGNDPRCSSFDKKRK